MTASTVSSILTIALPFVAQTTRPRRLSAIELLPGPSLPGDSRFIFIDNAGNEHYQPGTEGALQGSGLKGYVVGCILLIHDLLAERPYILNHPGCSVSFVSYTCEGKMDVFVWKVITYILGVIETRVLSPDTSIRLGHINEDRTGMRQP